MALPSGTRLGPYEILAPLGAGGMGEVYRAADTRLNRTVAVKVLPPAVADDPDRRQRFEREARAVSSLTHPHICALYDVGRQDDIEFLVMEYVEGDTLEARLMSGSLPLDQALQYGTEIAGALDHAHRRGIVHRDLKPSNIMVTSTGVKVLDFGLAKATSPDPAATMAPVPGTPTRTATLTAHGMILGTLQYAAPEQLEGRAADARSDIFACGAVLHEMLTGRKAFEGTSPASLIAAVLRTEPAPLTSVQPALPAALDRAVRKCLAKNSDDRWQTARDLMSELAWIRESGTTATVSQPPADRRRTVHRVAWIAACACVVATAVVLAALARMRFQQTTSDAGAVQFAVAAPEPATLLECNNCMAVSPDGRYLAFIARSGDGRELLWVRALDSVALRPLAGTDGARGPFWAPDNQTIGFHAKGKLRRVDVTGAICTPSWNNRNWGSARRGTRTGPSSSRRATQARVCRECPPPAARQRSSLEWTPHEPKACTHGRGFCPMASTFSIAPTAARRSTPVSMWDRSTLRIGRCSCRRMGIRCMSRPAISCTAPTARSWRSRSTRPAFV